MLIHCCIAFKSIKLKLACVDAFLFDQDSPLRASTQDVLFKGGAGTVSGGMGVGSFSASSSSSSSSATSASVSATDLGVQAPTGYWDPLGLNANADAATFNRRRAVEIKHGRVAMYATMGYIVPEYYKFPGGVLSLHRYAAQCFCKQGLDWP